jgi:hypothetical protein
MLDASSNEGEPEIGEQTAQACANAWFRQLPEGLSILCYIQVRFGEMLMVARSLVFVLVFLVCLAQLVAPILVDARHWWPRKPKR